MTNPDTTNSINVWEIARRHARDTMASIAECQMKTWGPASCVDGPTRLIELAIVRAMEEAGVKTQ